MMGNVSSRLHSDGAGLGHRNHRLLVAAMVLAVAAAIIASAFLFVPQAVAPELPGASVAVR